VFERVDFFMKKVIFIVLTIVVALLVYVNVNADEIVIPSSAVRFRIIANSNSIRDQKIKMEVKEYVDNYLGKKLIDVKNVSDAKDIIEAELDNLKIGIRSILLNNNSNSDFKINYGKNFFPDKLYKGIKYEKGSYDSLVIILGSGNGDNWWCVLFPPLCLLEVQDNEIDEVEYQFFVKKIIDHIFE